MHLALYSGYRSWGIHMKISIFGHSYSLTMCVHTYLSVYVYLCGLGYYHPKFKNRQLKLKICVLDVI